MRLNSIAANRHIHDGRPSDELLRLLLSFDAGRRLRLQVAGDGARMIIDDGPLDDPFDMGDYGQVDAADVTLSHFPKLSALQVSGIHSLVCRKKIVGVTLEAASGRAFHFWVDGDELHWGGDAALRAHDWLDGVVPEVSGQIGFLPLRFPPVAAVRPAATRAGSWPLPPPHCS